MMTFASAVCAAALAFFAAASAAVASRYSDIAKYDLNSSGEYTQGTGSCSLRRNAWCDSVCRSTR